jgi:hypothetical protein
MSHRRSVPWCALVLCILAGAGEAAAQVDQQPRFAASIGPQWLGAMELGGHDATETGNGRPPLTLFRTRSELRGGIGVTGGIGVRVIDALWLESSVRYHSARISTEVSGDFEGAPSVEAGESLQQLQIEGGAVWMPDAWHFGRRLQLYASGGLGYLRQLHRGQTLVETGQSYYAGGGAILHLPAREGGSFKGVGLRLDVRAVAFVDGAAFDSRAHTAPAAAVALFLRF